ncbi:unnamed protein product [Heligmosomoides polygyrus]|uniref:Uncharacterized protein n=1 Tax=Heligmosomoides polygyrus TaxID=6339 RepID=A0A183F7B1_HELPZ|nr:unnamed protein product [Heligmosomoides polygyrus]
MVATEREGSGSCFSHSVADGDNIDETWKDATDAITRAARLELGTTKPGRRCVDKQAWLLTDDVREKVREKKRLYHVFIGDETAHDWPNYREAKKAAKKAVAAAKAAYYADRITVSETEAVLKKMKSDKAPGPDDLPADLWKSKGWCPADWLTEFFNQVVAEKKAPESWH